MHHLSPWPATLDSVLKFLLHLFNEGLSHSTFKVYLAAIITHQPQDSEVALLFRHPTLKKFLKGLKNIRPTVTSPTPQWSLQLVLHQLSRHPFKPMATCSECLLSPKTIVLVAITSARRTSKLAVLISDPPFYPVSPRQGYSVYRCFIFAKSFYSFSS